MEAANYMIAAIIYGIWQLQLFLWTFPPLLTTIIPCNVIVSKLVCHVPTFIYNTVQQATLPTEYIWPRTGYWLLERLLSKCQ